MARLFLFTLLAFANFASPGSCTSQAAHGTGPCYTCGPLAASPAQALCSGTCVDTSTSSANCGSYGNSCKSAECVNDICAPACPSGKILCNDVCVDTQNDKNNCGSCGFVCPHPCPSGTTPLIFCQQGTCGYGPVQQSRLVTKKD
ncbi:uncharacterized protein EAF01_009454 [Botrytis porri]|uniref:uncharacterized protein n=1 Tax=Botrytis porri TaxID=87229 RepID=UPI0018FFA7E9|nr:uncharacterized protein EAF01_009454 [Botrytis porri]KAF7895492.1 hypothetical protein EAF01_009454 [Botrytis porri]